LDGTVLSTDAELEGELLLAAALVTCATIGKAIARVDAPAMAPRVNFFMALGDKKIKRNRTNAF
jgi:hypothetical protein